LGGLLEKELRFLSRAPRFRLVFLMGFSFGLLVWLPLAFGSNRGSAATIAANYLTFVSSYALLLLGEVSFYNVFGFDRGAAQAYYVLPVPFRTVLVAKNLAAVFFVVAEVTAVAAVCALLGMPISVARVIEAYSVTAVLSVDMLAVGNLSSTHFPRAVDPAQSWHSGSLGRFHAMLLLIYPLLSIPILLAYLARYAFASALAFYAVLGVAAVIAAALYAVAMESAVQAAERRKESILAALGQGSGPVAA
jgi:ABC-2 type transport system permease protein